MREHGEDCRERRAREYAVGIECEHGYDVCPMCDPCTCSGADGEHVDSTSPAPASTAVPTGANRNTAP